MYTVHDIVRSATTTTTCINGSWCPKRPINHTTRTLRERLAEAWAVFAGKADAVQWPEGQ